MLNRWKGLAIVLISEQFAHRLVALLGERFLRYLLVLSDEGTVVDHLQNIEDPELVSYLVGAVSLAPPNMNEQLDVMLFAVGVFGQYRADLGSTLTQHIRQSRGAAHDSVPAGADPVVQAIRRLASDIWPTLLLKPPMDGPRGFWMSSLGSIISSPHALESVRAFLGDPQLTQLFPEAPLPDAIEAIGQEVLDINSSWVLNTGRSGQRGLLQVLDAAVFHASILAQSGGAALDHQGIMNGVEETVASLRTLASGQAVEVPAFVGVAGPRLESRRSLPLGKGQLRNRRALESDMLLTNADRATAIFETTFPVQILKVVPNSVGFDSFVKEASKYWPRVEEKMRVFRQRVDRMRYAIVLSSPDAAEPLGVSIISELIADPTQVGGSPAWENDLRAFSEYPLGAELSAEVIRLHDLIQDLHPESLNIAMKRLISAVSQRADAVDAFIDAVVVWENAFGANQETTFRVTGAIAKLLESSNMQARLMLQQELKKLYGSRSLLVHGAREPKEGEAWAQRVRSIEVAILLLRALYEDRSDLLSLSSEDRGSRLLLEH